MPVMGGPGAPYGAILEPLSVAPAPPPRSAAMSTIGILGIVFGVLVTLGGGLQVGCRALVHALQEPAARNSELMKLIHIEMGMWGVMMLMSLVLIVIGVGVWRHREAARKAMLAWSVVALLVVAGRMATQALVLQPRAERFQKDVLEQHSRQTKSEIQEVMQLTRAWAIYGDLVVWVPYPLVSLILLSRPGVRERCS